jgi:uncharacterized protein
LRNPRALPENKLLQTSANPSKSHRAFTRRQFLTGAVGACLCSAGAAFYATGIEPHWVDFEEVPIVMQNLSPWFHGYRVAQISDIHMGDWTTHEHLQDVVGFINGHKPDLVTITGDFVTHNPEASAADLIQALKQLQARDGVAAVLGNHDHWSDAHAVRQVLRESRITDVSNGVYTVERGRALFHVAGVDDVWAGKAQLDRVLYNLPREGAAMLLAHEPDFANTSAATGRFGLQISGHSHGGQVIVPFFGPLKVPHLATNYPLGRYQVGEMVQYTNRGIGMISPHVRFNCRPEITLFTLLTA